MKKLNTIKRVLAGVLAMLTVAACMPANVGGFLTGSTGIVAKADDGEDEANKKVELDEIKVGTTFDPNCQYRANFEGKFYFTVNSSRNWVVQFSLFEGSNIDFGFIGSNDSWYFFTFCNELISFSSEKGITHPLLRVKEGNGNENNPFVFELAKPTYKVTFDEGITAHDPYTGDEINKENLNAINDGTTLAFESDKLFFLDRGNHSHELADYSDELKKYVILADNITSDISVKIALVYDFTEDTYNNSLVKAVEEAKSGSKIKLLDNVTINKMPDDGLRIIGKTLTLDLNGKTLSCEDSNDNNNNIGSFFSEEETEPGKLTITDTSTDKKGSIHANLFSDDNSRLTIEGGTFEGAIYNNNRRI